MPNLIDETGRWRWWYESIADWMIANPDGKLGDCAIALDKSPGTISMIVNSDLFKDYYAARRNDWKERHDQAIVSKTAKIAEFGLDLILEKMQAKRDTVPIGVLKEVTDSALNRLGYGVKPVGTPVPPGSTINGNVQIVQVSAQDLAEARAVIRNREQVALTPPPKQIEQGAAPALAPEKVAERDEEEVVDAASS